MLNYIAEDDIRLMVAEIAYELNLTGEQIRDVNAIVRYRLKKGFAAEAREMTRPGIGMAVHHIDGDPHNNAPENLRVVPMRENSKQQQERNDS
jgi:hypothetical protein